MPELPEVETMRRQLERLLVGRRLRTMEVRLPRVVIWSPGLGPDQLEGSRMGTVRRRAKWLLIDFDNGLSLVIHFNLTGQLFYQGLAGEVGMGHPVPAFDTPRPHKSTHIIFHFDDGSLLYYTDIRQFGRLHVMPGAEVERFLAGRKLGVEPLTDEFKPGLLATAAARKPKTKAKALLLDQHILVGIGNIYADESLHKAGIHPAIAAGTISVEALRHLEQSIREVLLDAVENGVAQVVNGKAKPGARLPKVHGREGEPCPICGTTIVKATIEGRGTYWCPKCQPKNDAPLAG